MYLSEYVSYYADKHNQVNRYLHSFDAKIIDGSLNYKNLKNFNYNIPHQYARLKSLTLLDENNDKEITKALNEMKKMLFENNLILERNILSLFHNDLKIKLCYCQ